MQERSARRQGLIRAARDGNDSEFGTAIKQADADDLAWLLERLNAQIDETPHWVEDPKQLNEILAKLRKQRIAVAGAMGNKATAERLIERRSKEIWEQSKFWVAVVLALGGWVVAAVIAIYD